MRTLLSLIVALVIGSSGCLSSCDGVLGGGSDSVLADPVDSVLAQPPSSGAVAVVGIDWPFTSSFLLEPGKETAFADNDPVETPTNFGDQSDIAVTQGTLASRPAFQLVCDVGPPIPCFYFDGGDRWVDTQVRASLAWLHDGTGAACYGVMEATAATGDQGVIATGAWSTTTERGSLVYFSGTATDRLVVSLSNGTASLGGHPTGGSLGADRTTAWVFTHGTARTNNQWVEYRGSVSAATGSNLNYAAAVSSSDPSYNLTIGSRALGSPGATYFTGYLFALPCEDEVHDASVISEAWAAIETVTGALPQ